MDREHLYTELSDYIAETFEVPRDLITKDADLVERLNLDSIDAIDLMVRIQELTGRKVTPEQFQTVRTINDVLNLVQAPHEKA